MCFAVQGSMQGVLEVAAQRLVSVVLTSKSVRAQWRVIIGVYVFRAWPCGVICCHRKRLGTGVSARSQFRVVSASCLFVFLNRVSESFGLSSRPIRSGDVRFHFLTLEDCVGRFVFACANFVRIQFPVSVSVSFAILPDRGTGSCGLLGSDREPGRFGATYGP